MSRKKFTFYTYDKDDLELSLFLESKVNVSQFVKDILEKYRKGKLVDYKSQDLQRQKMLIDIEYKQILTEIKRRELDFQENFGKTPSYQAKEAIKVSQGWQNKEALTNSYNPPEEKSLEKIIENNWKQFLLSLRTNSKNEWIANCKLCDTGFILPTKELSINRFKTHLRENHNEELLKI